MLTDIAVYTIAGKPLMFYFGVLTLLSFTATATIPWLARKTAGKVKFAWHRRLAVVSFSLAFLHALLVMFVYL